MYKSGLLPLLTQLAAILQATSHTFALRARVRYRLSRLMLEQSFMEDKSPDGFAASAALAILKRHLASQHTATLDIACRH